MSGLRYHLLSFTAAGLGVALGLGLGAGPVTDDTVASHERTTAALGERAGRLQERVDAMRTDAVADAKVVTALAAPLTAGRLTARTVLVVATPGATRPDVRRVAARIEAAGATVTGVLSLTKTYVDPARAQSPLEDLVLRLVPPGVKFAEGASAIERVGTVLARATVRRPTADRRAVTAEPGAAEVDQAGAEVIAGLDELGALHLAGDPGRRADLAVVVAGPGDRPEAEPALAGLLTALDDASLGAVLTGPGDATAGALRWARDATSDQLEVSASTVDSVDSQVGGAALVLALAEQVAGRSGHYGLGRGAREVIPADAAGG